jgi:hypothetical protein
LIDQIGLIYCAGVQNAPLTLLAAAATGLLVALAGGPLPH